jgi:predicted aspartyl protease
MKLFMIFSSLAIVLFLASCSSMKIIKQMGKEEVSSSVFKETIPFEFPQKKSIVIAVLHNQSNTSYNLKFDNHAPMCLAKSAIAKNKYMVKVGDFFVGKPTPDGKTIPNSYYQIDNLKFGNTIFNHVLINEIPDKSEDEKQIANYDGLFGKNLMEKGIWKIDFENQLITFTSSIDSFSDIQNYQKLATVFTGGNKIKVTTNFLDSNVDKVFEVDLGYSGSIILPKKEFDKIDVSKQAIITTGTVISVAGTQAVTRYTLDEVKSKIGQSEFTIKVTSNDKVTMNLLGLEFFAKFKYIIFDYINKEIYLYKENTIAIK